MGRKPNSICCICGKNFYARPNQIRNNKWGLTCSMECCAEHKRRISPLCHPSNMIKRNVSIVGKSINLMM